MARHVESGGTAATSPKGCRRGAALLEVVLSLGIFFLAVTILSAGLTSSLAASARMRDQAMAADLAVTAASEIQMGLLEAVQQGPDPLADEGPLSEWTREIDVEPVENIETMQRVYVRLANIATGRGHRLVFWMPAPAETLEETVVQETPGGEAGGPP